MAQEAKIEGWVDGIPEPNVMRHRAFNIISIILLRSSTGFV
jgi:hypothetical protein